MAKSERVAQVQLATRIPKALHRELKLYCVKVETSVMEFVTKAIEEKLALTRRAPEKGSRRHGRASR